MKRIRVLVANQFRLRRELIMTAMADRSDIEQVGKVSKKEDLTGAVEPFQPDVLILAIDEQDKYRAPCGFLLGRYPEMKIVALAQHRTALSSTRQLSIPEASRSKSSRQALATL